MPGRQERLLAETTRVSTTHGTGFSCEHHEEVDEAMKRAFEERMVTEVKKAEEGKDEKKREALFAKIRSYCGMVTSPS